jgi:steroid 5-alpha reductase family enzyme
MIKLSLVVYVYLVLQMSIVWIIYRLLKNPSVVDVSWSIGLMMSGLIYLWLPSITLRNGIISALLILWSLRLAGYLWFTRIRKGHVDKRYNELSSNWKINKSFGFFINFQLQALFIFIISVVFLFAGKVEAENLSSLDIIGCIVVILGIAGESLSDLQLQHFKSNNKKKVCNVGLWRYSRHPNYFFDWITWCGFTLFGLRYIHGYISIISPLFLYVIFNHITGPMTERGSIQSRGQAFIDYQRETSMFFPWFKKKANSA